MQSDHLRITEIFYSLQGESTLVGVPSVFVRLTGCPLRCGYCDTEYAFHGGRKMSLADILQEIKELNCKTICVTGGEPLAQPGCFTLLDKLIAQGYRVSLETSGAIDCSAVNPRVIKVLDIKTPGSKMVHKNHWANLDTVTENDQIKFVVCDRNDFDWSVKVCREKIPPGVEVLFSPAFGAVSPQTLADWILESHMPIRMQIQLHKLLWGDEPGK